MLEPGYLLLIFTTLATATAMAAYAPGVRKGAETPWLRVARLSVYATALGLVASAATLWYHILSHHYQYSYVYRYTSSDMPLRYVIAAFWGGQEGTFLLWALYGGLLAVFIRFKAKQYESPVLFFYLGIDLFLMLMLLKANPFAKLPQTPLEGNGLNPLLQDPWMTIHPPIMFFGFASLGIPAAYAMAAMVKEDWDNWVRRAIPWTTFGILALGTGLTLGGYWAYSILGWGGFWGWDPVENSSLVPWLLAVGLLHNQMIQLKRGIFKRLNLFLALLPFVLLTYSTFLTRSGVLADFSVHSFTDLGINQFLVAFMVVFLGGGLGLFVLKFRRIPSDKTQAPLASREYFMFLGSLVFTLFAVFVALGTSAPIITRIWGPASNVQPEFYNRMGLPFACLITLLVAIAPFLLWKDVSLRESLRRLMWPTLLSLAAMPVMVFLGVRHVPHLVLLVLSVFAVLANGYTILLLTRRKWRAAGGYLAHVGIGLAVLGIVASTSYGTKETVVLPKGEEVLSLGYGFKYLGRREIENGRKDAYDVALRTANGAYLVSPTMFFSDFNQGMMKKPAIHSFWSRDVYVSPVGHALDPLGDRIQTRVTLEKGTPVTSEAMTLTLFDVEARTPDASAAGAHDHDGAQPTKEVVATIDVLRNGVHTTLKPVLQGYSDGNTEVVPADIPNTDQAISLLATEATGTQVQVGIRWPALALMRGESGEIQGNKVSLNDYDVVMPAREGGSVKVFANAHVEMGGESFHVRPGIISRPGEDGNLEQIEAPIGRTGQNLVLDRIEANTGRAFFHIAQAPQEYLYAEVSLKPFIGLLWIGTGFTVFGLAFATFQRGRLANRLVAAEAGKEGIEAKKNGKRVAA
jgi:cytochrome c-type biogenesis protein CcmF